MIKFYEQARARSWCIFQVDHIYKQLSLQTCFVFSKSYFRIAVCVCARCGDWFWERTLQLWNILLHSIRKWAPEHEQSHSAYCCLGAVHVRKERRGTRCLLNTSRQVTVLKKKEKGGWYNETNYTYELLEQSGSTSTVVQVLLILPCFHTVITEIPEDFNSVRSLDTVSITPLTQHRENILVWKLVCELNLSFVSELDLKIYRYRY